MNEMLTRLLTSFIWACSLLMTAYTAYFFLTALFSLKKPRAYPRREPKARFAVLIAARNEEAVIGGLVESLLRQNYPRELYDVIVVPNNCTDHTALAAARAGASVLDCTVPTSTKGEVLDFALGRLFRREKEYDAVCVFDADNLVHPDFLQRMNDAWQAGARVAQGYRDSKNPVQPGAGGHHQRQRLYGVRQDAPAAGGLEDRHHHRGHRVFRPLRPAGGADLVGAGGGDL